MAPDDDLSLLRLRAEDADDLAVISACLQDALVPVRDLFYDLGEGLFLAVVNRFRWESGFAPAVGEIGHQRILCGLAFREVRNVSYRGFRRSEEDRILSLLAIRAEPGEDGLVILLEFSGGGTIRLDVALLSCHARDLGEPWPTPWRPSHDSSEWP
jgi:hypothetical protein